MNVSLVVIVRVISHLGPKTEHRLRSGQARVSLLGEAAAAGLAALPGWWSLPPCRIRLARALLGQLLPPPASSTKGTAPYSSY